MFIPEKLVKNSLLRSNLTGLVIGLGVGLVLNFFGYGISSREVNWSHIWLTFMFSILISVAISNIVCFAEYLFSRNINRLWVAILGYYGGSLIGVAIGHELAQLIVCWIYDMPYEFWSHINSLKQSLTIGVIVCSILFAYEMQKHRFASKLERNELELIKLKQLKTQAELQTLQSKINPHFLYNALNSIASLIHEDADKAEEMTLKLSRLFRYSISTQNENLASIRDELEVVKTYLDIERVRFGDRIRFDYDLDNSVMDRQIPRFLLQPLVENALKHGLSDSVNGVLTIAVRANDNRVEISVGDNGKAFPDELVAGYGMQSTYDKLNLLYQDDYDLQLINEPEKMIRISIPAR